MAIQNATDVVLSVTQGGSLQAIAHATSCSLSVNMDLRDSTTKSSAGWQYNLGGLKSWELSGDAFVEVDGSGLNSEEIFALMIGDQDDGIDCTFGISGMTYSGKAFITSFSVDAGVEENVTYSISLTGSGILQLT